MKVPYEICVHTGTCWQRCQCGNHDINYQLPDTIKIPTPSKEVPWDYLYINLDEVRRFPGMVMAKYVICPVNRWRIIAENIDIFNETVINHENKTKT